MYELIDAREYGLELKRPLIICELWGKRRRRVYALQTVDTSLARQIVQRLNIMLEADQLEAEQVA